VIVPSGSVAVPENETVAGAVKVAPFAGELSEMIGDWLLPHPQPPHQFATQLPITLEILETRGFGH
jgi:hypothetical protein